MAYLRPETAQAMFVQFKNVLDSQGLKPPFGIAQMGKSFRNEVTVEHFIFRSCEFEQMEMEFYCEPGTQREWMSYWKEQRMAWWQRYANYKEDFRFRQHAKDEMAFYADDCYDVESAIPGDGGSSRASPAAPTTTSPSMRSTAASPSSTSTRRRPVPTARSPGSTSPT